MSEVLNLTYAGEAEASRYVRILLAGESGSGKTRFAATAPAPVWAAAYPGMTTLARNNLPFVEINNENDLFNLKVAIENKSVEADTIVIDTVDELQRRLFIQKLQAEKRDVIKSEDWNWVAAKMNGIFASLSQLPVNIIYITHLKEFGGFDGEDLVFKPNLQGSIATQIFNYVDYAGVIETRTYDKESLEINGEETSLDLGPNTYIRFAPNSNFPWVHDHTATLPAIFNVDEENDFYKILELRKKMKLEPTKGYSIEQEFTAANDAPTKDKEVPGMSQQDRIAQLLKGNPEAGK